MDDNTRVSRRRMFLKAAGAATIAGLAGCSSNGGNGGNGGSGGGETTGTTTGSAGSGDAIVIGDAAPLSGSFSPWGTTHLTGLEFAVKEINANGGVLGGRELTIATQDTEANPQTATTAMKRLINSKDAAVVTGPVSSDVGIACRSVAEELEVPLLPNQSSSPALLTKDTNYVFRVGGTATPTFVLATKGFIQKRGYKQYAAIYADYAYGQSYNSGIQRFIKGTKGLNVSVQSAPPQISDVQTYLRQVPNDVDFLDLGGHPIEFFTLVKQAKQLGLKPKYISGPNLPTSVMYNALQNKLFEGVAVFAAVNPDSTAYKEVAKRFVEEEDASVFEQYHAFGYTTGQLIATAIDEAGTADPKAIRDAISGIDMDTILAYPSISYTDWGELEEAKLHGLEFSSDPPPYASSAPYSVDSFYESRVFDPIDPTKWG